MEFRKEQNRKAMERMQKEAEEAKARGDAQVKTDISDGIITTTTTYGAGNSQTGLGGQAASTSSLLVNQKEYEDPKESNAENASGIAQAPASAGASPVPMADGLISKGDGASQYMKDQTWCQARWVAPAAYPTPQRDDPGVWGKDW